MGLQMKSVKYSSRGGYTIEWQEPASIRLNVSEALYVLALLKNGVSISVLEEKFSFEEREAIYRYHQMHWEALRENLNQQQNQIRSLSALQKSLKQVLQWGVDSLNLTFRDYLREVLCWPALDPKQVKTNQMYRDALKRHCFERAVYERLYQQYGLPSPKILQEVEWRLSGPLIPPDPC